MTSLMEFSSNQDLNVPITIVRPNSPQFAAVLAELESQEHDDKEKHKQAVNLAPVIQITQATALKHPDYENNNVQSNENDGDPGKDFLLSNASKNGNVLAHHEVLVGPEDSIDDVFDEELCGSSDNMLEEQNNHLNNTSKNDHQHRLSRDRTKKSVKNETNGYFLRRGSSPAHLEKFRSLADDDHALDKTQHKDAKPKMTKIKSDKHKIDLTLNVNPDKVDESNSSELRAGKREVWLSPRLQRKSKTTSNSNSLPLLGSSPAQTPTSTAKSTSPTSRFGSSLQDIKTFVKSSAPLSPRGPRRILPRSHASADAGQTSELHREKCKFSTPPGSPNLRRMPRKCLSRNAKSFEHDDHLSSQEIQQRQLSTSPISSPIDKQRMSSKHERSSLSNAFGSVGENHPPQFRKNYVSPASSISKPAGSPATSPPSPQSPERASQKTSPANSNHRAFDFTTSIASNEDETSDPSSPRSPSKPCSPRSPNSPRESSPNTIPKPPSSPRPARRQIRPSTLSRPKSPCPLTVKHIDTLQVNHSPMCSPRFQRRSQSSPAVSPILQRKASSAREITPEVEQRFQAFARSIAQSPRRKSQAFDSLKEFATSIIDQADDDSDNDDLPEVSMSDVLKTWQVTDSTELKVLKYIGVRDRAWTAPSFAADRAMELKDCRYLRHRGDEDVNNNDNE